MAALNPMVPKLHYASLGPVPVMAVAEVYAQLEAQNWTVKACVFAGMGQAKLSLPGQQGMFPLFMFICSKALAEGEKPLPPEIKMSTFQ